MGITHSTAAQTLWGRNLFGQANAAKTSTPTGTGTFFADLGKVADDADGTVKKDAAPSSPQLAAAPVSPEIKIPGTSSASAGFYTQSIAQAPADDTASLDKASGMSAEDKFMNFVRKNPVERLRDQILHEMGLTEDDIKNMSPDEQAKIEEKIREKIQEALKKKMDGVAAKDPADATMATMAAAV